MNVYYSLEQFRSLPIAETSLFRQMNQATVDALYAGWTNAVSQVLAGTEARHLNREYHRP
jgi:hypothetical protein